jgi:hypothetical protein
VSCKVHEYNYDVTKTLPMLGRPRGEVFYGVELEVEVSRKLKSRGGDTPQNDDDLYLGATIESLQDCRCDRCLKEIRKRTSPQVPVKVVIPKISTFQQLVDSVGESLVDFALLKHDGTITNGFEIVTAPSSLGVHRTRWEKFFGNTEALAFLSSPKNCGMHVHISRKPLSVEMRQNMHLFVNDPANQKFITLIAERGPGSYNKYIPKRKQDIETVNLQKYEALNFTPKRTIEMRIFASTTKYETLMKNLEFCASLVHWVQTHKIETPAKADYISGLERNRKVYPHLVKFLEDAKEL